MLPVRSTPAWAGIRVSVSIAVCVRIGVGVAGLHLQLVPHALNAADTFYDLLGTRLLGGAGDRATECHDIVFDVNINC